MHCWRFRGYLRPLLSWAQKTLAVLEKQPEAVLQHCTSERLEEKFGWLREYGQDLDTWLEYETISQATFDVVRREGYFRGATALVADHSRPHVKSESGQELQAELVAFVATQSSVVAEGTRLPGSTA